MIDRFGYCEIGKRLQNHKKSFLKAKIPQANAELDIELPCLVKNTTYMWINRSKNSHLKRFRSK